MFVCQHLHFCYVQCIGKITELICFGNHPLRFLRKVGGATTIKILDLYTGASSKKEKVVFHLADVQRFTS